VKRQTILIAVVGTLVVLVAWYMLLWGPKGRDLSAAKTERATAEQASSDADLKLARLNSVNKGKDVLLADQVRFTSLVPPTADVAGIITQINDAATAAGVSFLSITPTSPTAALVAGGPSNVPLAMTVKGAYSPVMDFIGRLSILQRFITVDGMTLTPELTGSTVTSVSVSLTARAFTQQAVTVPGAAASTTAAAPAAGAK
jgi:Tfp pilus assembly protein PilO